MISFAILSYPLQWRTHPSFHPCIHLKLLNRTRSITTDCIQPEYFEIQMMDGNIGNMQPMCSAQTALDLAQTQFIYKLWRLRNSQNLNAMFIKCSPNVAIRLARTESRR
jgi:hypothetical protein